MNQEPGKASEFASLCAARAEIDNPSPALLLRFEQAVVEIQRATRVDIAKYLEDVGSLEQARWVAEIAERCWHRDRQMLREALAFAPDDQHRSSKSIPALRLVKDWVKSVDG